MVLALWMLFGPVAGYPLQTLFPSFFLEPLIIFHPEPAENTSWPRLNPIFYFFLFFMELGAWKKKKKKKNNFEKFPKKIKKVLGWLVKQFLIFSAGEKFHFSFFWIKTWNISQVELG